MNLIELSWSDVSLNNNNSVSGLLILQRIKIYFEPYLNQHLVKFYWNNWITSTYSLQSLISGLLKDDRSFESNSHISKDEEISSSMKASNTWKLMFSAVRKLSSLSMELLHSFTAKTIANWTLISNKSLS